MNKQQNIAKIRTELKRTQAVMRTASPEDKVELKKLSRDLNLALSRLTKGDNV